MCNDSLSCHRATTASFIVWMVNNDLFAFYWMDEENRWIPLFSSVRVISLLQQLNSNLWKEINTCSISQKGICSVALHLHIFPGAYLSNEFVKKKKKHIDLWHFKFLGWNGLKMAPHSRSSTHYSASHSSKSTDVNTTKPHFTLNPVTGQTNNDRIKNLPEIQYQGKKVRKIKHSAIKYICDFWMKICTCYGMCRVGMANQIQAASYLSIHCQPLAGIIWVFQ